MPYEPPGAGEKGLVTAAAVALGFGILWLPATAIFGILTFAFANFYRGFDFAAVVASCVLCPVSSIGCIILAKLALSGAIDPQTKQSTIRLLLAAWLSVPAAALFWVVVAKSVMVHR